MIHFCPWAGRLQDGAAFLQSLPGLDLGPRVSDPSDPGLMRMARLDCDWHGENVRALGAMSRDGLEFLPVLATGIDGLLESASPAPPDEERWLVISGQHPQMLGKAAARVFAALRGRGIRILYYAFDEASRTMACFGSIAPHLSVLIHDERPLDPAGLAALRPGCLRIHRSWVANLVPFAAPFREAPEPKLLFLGSKLGMTEHRRRQLAFLEARFPGRLVAFCDHSVPVAGRADLGRYQASLCPEGRRFTSAAMGRTHTDRPFWSGCLGMVPVSEDSRGGGRLEELHRSGLIVRYPHGDLEGLAAACERAFAMGAAERRRIYEHFNRRETIAAVVADAIHAAGANAPC